MTQPQVIHLNLIEAKPFEPEFPEDVARIKAALAAEGIEVTDFTIDKAWARYSESVFATWINLPDEAAEISALIRPFLPKPSPLQVLESAMVKLGHGRFRPESITAFRQDIEDWGWKGTAEKAGVDAKVLRTAYEATMASMREMFAPLRSDDE